MKFLDLDKAYIKAHSILTKDGYYEYCLGSAVEVTTIKQNHKNSLISNNLSSDTKDDRLMVKYNPVNKVWFSQNLIDYDIEDNFVSCSIDSENGRILVGLPDEFSVNSGLLMFSGYLSLNDLVQKERPILCNDRLKSTIHDRVRMLSVGLKSDRLFALYYIPCVRGIMASTTYGEKWGISPNSFKKRQCADYVEYTVNDWFENTKIKEIL